MQRVPYMALALPEINLHCDHARCGGLRVFATSDTVETTWTIDRFVNYLCQNCKSTKKTYALRLILKKGAAELMKLGEAPPFGPPTPARLATLVGPDRVKGRRCESQSLGIAAFAYYRRVVESRKNAIIDEIVRVSRGLGAPHGLLAELELAKQEVQFTKAVESVKHALPQALLINGHNPLTLLHSALSDGLHARTDEECLGLAQAIRIVLVEFAERAAEAMKNEAGLNAAVSRLLAVKSSRPT